MICPQANAVHNLYKMGRPLEAQAVTLRHHTVVCRWCIVSCDEVSITDKMVIIFTILKRKYILNTITVVSTVGTTS